MLRLAGTYQRRTSIVAKGCVRLSRGLAGVESDRCVHGARCHGIPRMQVLSAGVPIDIAAVEDLVGQQAPRQPPSRLLKPHLFDAMGSVSAASAAPAGQAP